MQRLGDETMSFMAFAIIALNIIGIIGVVFLMFMGMWFLYFWLKAYFIKKRIPQTIIKEAENERLEKEIRRRTAASRYQGSSTAVGTAGRGAIS